MTGEESHEHKSNSKKRKHKSSSKKKNRHNKKKKMIAAAVAEHTGTDSEKDKTQKGGKSIRQQKLERFVQREAVTILNARETVKDECTNYLYQWKNNKDHWKFIKARQIRLFDHKFDTNMVSDEIWPIWLEYFASSHENIKKRLLDAANKIIVEMDEYSEKSNKEESGSESEEPDKDEVVIKDDETGKDSEKPLQPPDPLIYKRARDIIQHIQE